ncbi:MAG: hypothetical protein E3J70_10770 [Candidatus Heimdallarchaeota archaeon]|nr:MAG: hypothetical protein E3J70_10770 [Candidatus Heimdallarchaeota archaeon]
MTMLETAAISLNTKIQPISLIYDYGSKKNTRVYFWSDNSITIKAIVKNGFIRLPKNLANFAEIATDVPFDALLKINDAIQKIELIVRERRVKGKLFAFLIREFGKKTILTKKNHGTEIQLIISTNVFKFTNLLKTIEQFVQDGGHSKSLYKFLEEPIIANKFTREEKINWIKLKNRIQNKRPKADIEIKLATEQILLFEDDDIAAQFIVAKNSEIIALPLFLDQLLVHTNSKICYIRDDVLSSSLVRETEYNKSFSSSIHGESIVILCGGGTTKTKLYTTLLSFNKKYDISDGRFYLGLVSLAARKDFTLILDLIESLIKRNRVLPIIREQVMTTAHIDRTFEQRVHSLFSDLPLAKIFVFKEALLLSKTGDYQKIVDWFLVFGEENNQSFTIELKTLSNFDHKTKKLKQTIAEYSYLLEKIPEARTPVIIINWNINKRWRDYASQFGLIILDNTDIMNLETFRDFQKQLEIYVQQYLISPEKKKQYYNKQSTKLIKKTLQLGVMSRSAIRRYSSYLGLTIKIVKNLLTFYQIMDDVDVNNRYHDHRPILIDNPENLLQLHERLLTEGTAVVIEEELAHCTKRLAKVRANPQLANSSTSKISRRRETYEISKLQELNQHLSCLLTLQEHWSKLQPLGVKLYFQSSNDGQPFEELVYDSLKKEGYQVIRNVSLRIGRVSQEIDLLAFSFGLEGELAHRCIISCTDKSSISFVNLKKNIELKYYKLHSLVKVFASDYTGILFVLVRDLHLPNIQELLQELQRLATSRVEIIVIGKKQIISGKPSSIKCHREVSFESIYIERRLFGWFILYIYRKITIKTERVEIKKRRDNRLDKESYTSILLSWTVVKDSMSSS